MTPRIVPSTSWYRNRSTQTLTDTTGVGITTTDGESILVNVVGTNISTNWS